MLKNRTAGGTAAAATAAARTSPKDPRDLYRWYGAPKESARSKKIGSRFSGITAALTNEFAHADEAEKRRAAGRTHAADTAVEMSRAPFYRPLPWDSQR